MNTVTASALANVRLLGGIAEVKAAAGPGELPRVSLLPEDAPVVNDLGNGLAAAYVVDEGDHFSYVQQRDLSASG